ncbi:translation initiation factor IF-3 [Candidatus Westeberhardia cardiocondylae]|uniref:translation initiation factor IF-3 n=1 Tax=Candidatus Westeberhardia cardiocondylae TaxID=1594731 RepID=UPI002482027A|nr:translation initiation factor IF-3 [Candidatus Westeberhardia cardiocondylae]
MKAGKKNKLIHLNRINNEIFSKKIRLIDFYGKLIGIVPLNQGLKQAEGMGFDLVEISPNSTPPVCRIMDYGKFVYEKNKSFKEHKKKQKVIQIKEIKFRPNTDEGDYKIKLRNIIRFLNHGNKVKITLRFRGRETIHHNIARKVLYRIRDDLIDFAIIESISTKVEGRQMNMIIYKR